MKRIIIRVYGGVQGVFFRQTTRKVARKLGLKGYVKNMGDGSVYIEAEGPDDKLNELLKFSKRGPSRARVERVESQFLEPQNSFFGFEYRY